MRTTLSIDDDVLAAAEHLAEQEHRTVGEVISTLARRGLSSATGSSRIAANAIPLLPCLPGATPVTLELVNQLRDDLP